MAYTLTQARGLLTASELELFDQSRAQPIKAFTSSRLRAKVSRARAMRDKYRDLYRRQTVDARTRRSAGKSAPGGDNERTKKKSDIFGEVLGRFEARLEALDAKADREAGGNGKAKAKATAKATTTPRPQPKATPRTGAKRITLRSAVKQALASKQASMQAAPGDDHSPKAPSSRSPLASTRPLVQPSAPLDMAAAAERVNLLKEKPRNKAIQGHQGAQVRRTQGKRDAA